MNKIVNGVGILIWVFSAGCSDRETTVGSGCFDTDITSLDVRSVDLFGYSTEGGVARFYHEGQHVEIIDVRFYGESGYAHQIYRREGAGLLVCDSIVNYTRPIYDDSELPPEIAGVETRSVRIRDVSDSSDPSEMRERFLELIEVFERGVGEWNREVE